MLTNIRKQANSNLEAESLRRVGRPLAAATRRWGVLVTIVAVVVFIAWFASLAVANHQAWQTWGYDLGNADQALWNTAQGRPLEFTNWVGKDPWFKEPTRLAMHVEPIYLLMVPLYWAWDDVRALLIFQVVAVSLGAFAAYRLARRLLAREAAGVVFALAYLLNTGVHWLVISDFHAVALAAPLLLAAYDFLEERRTWPFLLCALLAMMTKENIALAVAGMGVWAWIAQGRRRFGALTAIAALSWFVVAVFGIIPAYSTIDRSPFLAYYEGLSDAGLVLELLRRLLASDGPLYLAAYLLPLAGLPLLSPLALIPALPDLAINLLSGNPIMNAFGRQYVAALVPVGVAAATMGMANLWRWWHERQLPWLPQVRGLSLALLVVCALLGARAVPTTPLARGFAWPEVTAHKQKLPGFAALIPPAASLCTADNLNPHFSHREKIHLLPYTLDCEYVLLDVLSAPFLASNEDGVHELWYKRLIEDGDFGVIAADDGILLLKRGATVKPLPEAFYHSAQPEFSQPTIAASGSFGDQIQFLGYDAREQSGQPPYVRLYLAALEDLEVDYSLRIYLIEEPASIVAATEQAQPTLVWYPTSLWKPGQTVTVRANTYDWNLSLEPGKDYALALGVDLGYDAWDPEQRLAYQEDVKTGQLPRRFEADTLVYLLSFDSDGRIILPARKGSLPTEVHPWNATLDGGIDLVGFQFREEDTRQGSVEARSGETLQLRLYWRVSQPIDRDYTVFVHLVDSSGRVVAQGDDSPLGGSWPTSRWSTGDLVPDRYRMPLEAGLSTGEYHVVVGMYLPATGERVGVAGEGADSTARHITVPLPVQVEGLSSD